MKIKQTLLAGTAAIALVTGASIGLAQSPGGGMGGADTKTQGTQQRGGAETRSPATERQGGQGMQREGGQNERRGQAQGQRERDPMTGQGQREGQRDGQQRDMQRGQIQEKGQQEKGQSGQREMRRDRDSDGERRTQERGTQERGKERVQERGQEQRGKAAGERREGGRETTGSAPAQVTTEQRTRIRERRSDFARGRVERSRINFNISVGTTVPRTVTLYELPPTIVQVVPAWRSYRYILVDEEIIIIDPGTHRIIAVIDA